MSDTDPNAAPAPARSPRAVHLRRAVGLALTLTALGLIAWATLQPGPGALNPRPIDLADRIANVFLFVPLGAGLALLGLGAARALVASLLLSCSVELIQLYLPGRDASLYDVLSNSLGAGLGALLWRTLAARPQHWRAHLAFTCTILLFTALGWLARPAVLPGEHLLQWQPPTGTGARWTGKLERLTADRAPVWMGFTRTGPLQQIVDGAPLYAQLRFGLSQPTPTPIFIWRTEAGEHALTLTTQNQDLELRVADRGSFWGLPAPSATWPGALTQLVPNDPYTLRIQLREGGACLSLDPLIARCGVGPRLARSWARIRLPKSFGPTQIALLDLLWFVGFGVFLMWWSPSMRWRITALSLVVAWVALLSAETALGPPTGGDLAALLFGATLGSLRAILRRARRTSPPPQAPPAP